MSKGYDACDYCSQKGQSKFCNVCTSSDRNRLMNKRRDSDDDGDFLTSAVIGAVTGSAIVGAVLGYLDEKPLLFKGEMNIFL